MNEATSAGLYGCSACGLRALVQILHTKGFKSCYCNRCGKRTMELKAVFPDINDLTRGHVL